MRREKPTHPGPRIFIAGLGAFEIVFLPETGQISSRLPTTQVPSADPGEVPAGDGKARERS